MHPLAGESARRGVEMAIHTQKADELSAVRNLRV